MAANRKKLMASANPFNEIFQGWLEFDDQWDTTEAGMNRLLREFIDAPQKDWHKAVFIEALSGHGVVPKKIKGTRYYCGGGLSKKGQRMADTIGHKHCVHYRRPDHVSVVAAE